MASIPRFAIVTLLLVVGSPAMVYGLTTFVDHDFVDADSDTGYNHWGGWDPASGKTWTFVGPYATSDCPPSWNPGKGVLGPRYSELTTARLDFGAPFPGGGPGRVDPSQHEKVHVEWAWRLGGVNETAEFFLLSGNDTFLKTKTATNDALPYSTALMDLYYGEHPDHHFTLVENVQPGQFYRVEMELDMRYGLNGHIVSASASRLIPQPDDPEIFHALEDVPIEYTVGIPGFDTLYATYLGSTYSNWDVFKVVEVPEPASLALLAFGGLALARRRRKA